MTRCGFAAEVKLLHVTRCSLPLPGGLWVSGLPSTGFGTPYFSCSPCFPMIANLEYRKRADFSENSSSRPWLDAEGSATLTCWSGSPTPESQAGDLPALLRQLSLQNAALGLRGEKHTQVQCGDHKVKERKEEKHSPSCPEPSSQEEKSEKGNTSINPPGWGMPRPPLSSLRCSGTGVEAGHLVSE